MTTAVFILGPTGTGKSNLAIAVAREFRGEVISADSMQVYRGFDIGTAKLSATEMGGIPHHLIDCCDPRETFSAGDFQKLAEQKIEEITGRGRLPVVAGGTGLYLRALLLGLSPVGSADRDLRRRLRERAEKKGIEAMHQMLSRLDPATAERLGRGDSQRILRALEYRLGSGRRLSEAIARSPFGGERFEAVKFGLRLPRAELRRRIDQRVEAMFAAGWVEEVEHLLGNGVHSESQAFKAIGYREIVDYLKKEVSLEQAKEKIKRATKQYAKRQETWFRREPGIIWIDAVRLEAARTEVVKLIKARGVGDPPILRE
jgi:tRNA dimethylallyltransferase